MITGDITMKIRSAIRAGAQSCPEAAYYQDKAQTMAQKVYNCSPKNQTYVPVYTAPIYTVPPTGSESGFIGSYPDRSGICG
jgi:hypothetical protein